MVVSEVRIFKASIVAVRDTPFWPRFVSNARSTSEREQERAQHHGTHWSPFLRWQKARTLCPTCRHRRLHGYRRACGGDLTISGGDVAEEDALEAADVTDARDDGRQVGGGGDVEELRLVRLLKAVDTLGICGLEGVCASAL